MVVDTEQLMVYILFGFSTKGGVYTNSIYKVDVKKKTSHLLFKDRKGENRGPSPIPRGEQTCHLNGNNIFIFGGMNLKKKFNDLWKFDLQTNLW